MKANVEDEIVAELDAVLARLAQLAATPAHGDDPSRVDRIAVLEKLRGAVAAAQYAEMVAFGRSQVEAQIQAGTLDPARSAAASATRSGSPARSRPGPDPTASASPAR